MFIMDKDRTGREKAFVAISSSVALTKENLLHVHMLKVLMHKIGNDRRIVTIQNVIQVCIASDA